MPGVSPHQPGSEADQAWLAGFGEDGTNRLKILGDAVKKAASITAKAKAGPDQSEAERALDGEPGFVGEGLQAPAPAVVPKEKKPPQQADNVRQMTVTAKPSKKKKSAKVKEAA